MSKSINTSVVALAISTGILVGCENNTKEHTWVEKLGEQVCNHYLNILSNDPKNPNSQIFHARWLLHPIVFDCSTTIQSEAKTTAKIKYDRSVSLANPTAWKVLSSTVEQWKKQVTDFAKTINKAPQIWANVKPYFISKTTPVITIIKWSVIWNASAEGRIEWWDKSLIENNAVWNTQIAMERANAIKNGIIWALEQTWAKVNGQERIILSSKINPLTSNELGELYAEWLKMNGNWKNIVMDRIAKYNTEWVSTPSLEQIIWEKRFAEASIQYTASGIDRVIDVSNWNFVYWLWILSALWLAGRNLTKRVTKKHSSNTLSSN